MEVPTSPAAKVKANCLQQRHSTHGVHHSYSSSVSTGTLTSFTSETSDWSSRGESLERNHSDHLYNESMSHVDDTPTHARRHTIASGQQPQFKPNTVEPAPENFHDSLAMLGHALQSLSTEESTTTTTEEQQPKVIEPPLLLQDLAMLGHALQSLPPTSEKTATTEQPLQPSYPAVFSPSYSETSPLQQRLNPFGSTETESGPLHGLQNPFEMGHFPSATQNYNHHEDLHASFVDYTPSPPQSHPEEHVQQAPSFQNPFDSFASPRRPQNDFGSCGEEEEEDLPLSGNKILMTPTTNATAHTLDWDTATEDGDSDEEDEEDGDDIDAFGTALHSLVSIHNDKDGPTHDDDAARDHLDASIKSLHAVEHTTDRFSFC